MQHLVESSESVWQDEWDEINGVVSLTILPALSCNDNVLGVETSSQGTSNPNGNGLMSEWGLKGAGLTDSIETINKKDTLIDIFPKYNMFTNNTVVTMPVMKFTIIVAVVKKLE